MGEGEPREIMVGKKVEDVTWRQGGASRQRPMTTPQGGCPGKPPAGQDEEVFALLVTIGSAV